MEAPCVEIVNGLLIREGTVLLVKRSAHRKAYPDTWSFPGGHAEAGETMTAALARELGEEIGVIPTKHFALRVIADPNADVRRPIMYHMFVVEAWRGGEPVLLGDEHCELRWYHPAVAMRLPDLALPDAYRELFDTLSRDVGRHTIDGVPKPAPPPAGGR